LKTLDLFSLFFFVLINSRGQQWVRGKNRYVGCDIIDHSFDQKKGNLIEKTVSEGTAKLSRRNVFSPFFLPPSSVLINERGRQWQRGKHRSVGCDIIDRAFDQKEAI
jgi:hypothetical protein